MERPFKTPSDLWSPHRLMSWLFDLMGGDSSRDHAVCFGSVSHMALTVTMQRTHPGHCSWAPPICVYWSGSSCGEWRGLCNRAVNTQMQTSLSFLQNTTHPVFIKHDLLGCSAQHFIYFYTSSMSAAENVFFLRQKEFNWEAQCKITTRRLPCHITLWTSLHTPEVIIMSDMMHACARPCVLMWTITKGLGELE